MLGFVFHYARFLHLKLTNNKVTKLAGDKIEEITVDETIQGVTAKAPDLIQRTAEKIVSLKEYVHYLLKQKLMKVMCITTFYELVKAMQAILLVPLSLVAI